MNLKDRKLWFHINRTLRKRRIHASQSKFINTVRHSQNESLEHFLAKAKKCHELYVAGKPYICECWTEDGKRRYDILSILDNEILEYETNEKVDKSADGSIRIEVKRLTKKPS